MMGTKTRTFVLLPPDHFYRHLERVLDRAFVCDLVRGAYAQRGGRAGVLGCQRSVLIQPQSSRFQQPGRLVDPIPERSVFNFRWALPRKRKPQVEEGERVCNQDIRCCGHNPLEAQRLYRQHG
jgi:hypothetical protein